MKAVNLLPGEHKRARAAGEGKGRAYAVLGGLAVLLLVVTAYVLTTNKINERTTAAAEASQEADAYQAQAVELGSYSDFASVAQTRLVSVAAVASERFDWERLMEELARVMPAGSWLQSIDATTTGAEEAVDPTSAAPPATGSPTAVLTACTPSQTDAARMMVRLRRMYRVVDVELTQSVRDQAAVGPPTIDSCGTLFKLDLTVSFAPSPADEAPSGADRVPASLGGGS